MILSIFNISLSFLLPLVLNLIFTPIIISIAHSKKLFDATDERKTHVGQIPRLGGIGIFISLLVAVITINLIFKFEIPFAFYIGLFLIFVSGVVDDFKPIKPIIKLLTQIAASLALIVGGITFSQVYIPFLNIMLNLGYFSYPITIMWIIGMTNALNLLDGMDGQAGGVSFISVFVFGIISLILGQFGIAVLAFILAGALLGFLCFNLPPAKIFMGDSGALTLGYFLAALPLLYQSPEIKGKIVLVVIALLIIPILDVFSALIRRTMDGRSFFSPDRGHIHHKFTDLTSLNTKQILAVIYLLCLMSAVFAFLFLFKTNILTNAGLFLNIVIHLLLFRFLHKRKKRDLNS